MPEKAQDDDVVMSLVELALALPADEQASYVRSACADDSELFEQVWKYVEGEQRMNGFLLDPFFSLLSEHHFEPGEVLENRFRIVREVARGGMGIVYEATDQKLNRRIAIKCAQAGFQRRLPPEVRNAGEINHPNVCKTFDIHTTTLDGCEVDFISMEFLEGPTLAARVREGALPEGQARLIALQLCAALAEAHRKQVIHGDLKSNNVILTTAADGSTRAVITDFGLAHQLEASRRALHSDAGGTPDYMAPELWKGGKPSMASDVYALGVILHELATGRRPFPSQSPVEERLDRKPPAIHSKSGHLIARCLDPNPVKRPQNGMEVARALAPSDTRRWFLAAVAAVALAVISVYVTYRNTTALVEWESLAVLRSHPARTTPPSAKAC